MKDNECAMCGDIIDDDEVLCDVCDDRVDFDDDLFDLADDDDDIWGN